MMLGGITTTNEMYFFPEAVVEAAKEAGIRAVVSPGVADVPGWERFGTPFDMVRDAVHLRDAHRADDLIEIGLGPHSAYALGIPALREVAETARSEDMPVHVHLAETRAEEEDVAASQGGRTSAALLADLGVFDGRCTVAHAVWVTDEDVEIMAEHRVGVAHCPGSNGKLASGIAPVAAMRRTGVAVGLATDGPGSNNDLDLLEEARLALLYARLRHGDAAALGVEDALRMMTSEAAAALGRDDIGVLAPGKRADMICVSLDHPAYEPVVEPRDVLSHLVWAGSSRDVTHVWIGGGSVVEGGEFRAADVMGIRAAVRAIARRIAAG
jgi:5-methylthioadenosine/S-adenosylhomocysteine deaminase